MINMEQIEMFIAFMELVRNPAKYDVMLKEMKERAEELKQVVEAYTDVKSANKYFDKLKQEHSDKLAKLDSERKEFDAYKEKQMSELKRLSADLDVKRINVEKLRVESDTSYEQSVAERIAVERIQAEVTKQKQNLASYEVQLTEREKRLQSKEDKLKQLLG